MCREFGISRKTGYKIFERYKERGLEALTDRSRRPVRYANQLPEQIESADRRASRREKPHWGARKIRERLSATTAGDVKVPARSTIHAVLDRHGLVTRARAPRTRAEGTPLSERPAAQRSVVRRLQGRVHARQSALLLSADRHRSCLALICCCAKPWNPPRKRPAFTAFERLFRERGLPQAIRSDNGVPFASPQRPCSISPSSRSGGCGSASPSSASGPVIRSRTAGTSACT